MIRNCVICGKEFDTKSGQKKYCSLECKQKRDGLVYFTKYHIENPNAKITSKCSGRDIEKLKVKFFNNAQKYCIVRRKVIKRTVIKTCMICGNKFETASTAQKYCSADCKRKAVNARAVIRLHKLNPNARYYTKDKNKMKKVKPVIRKSEIGFCKECGREFKIKSLTPEYYCSEECELKSLHRKQNLFSDTTFTWLEDFVHQSWSRAGCAVVN